MAGMRLPRYSLRYLMLCVSLLALDMGSAPLLFHSSMAQSTALLVSVWCAYGVIVGAAIFARVPRAIYGAIVGAVFQFMLCIAQGMKFTGRW
jgi:hypothetical protein